MNLIIKHNKLINKHEEIILIIENNGLKYNIDSLLLVFGTHVSLFRIIVKLLY